MEEKENCGRIINAREAMALMIVDLQKEANAMRAAQGDAKAQKLQRCKELEYSIDRLVMQGEFATAWGSEIRAMREFQKDYYATKNPESLEQAKRLERSVLECAKTLLPAKSSDPDVAPNQLNLFQ